MVVGQFTRNFGNENFQYFRFTINDYTLVLLRGGWGVFNIWCGVWPKLLICCINAWKEHEFQLNIQLSQKPNNKYKSIYLLKLNHCSTLLISRYIDTMKSVRSSQKYYIYRVGLTELKRGINSKFASTSQESQYSSFTIIWIIVKYNSFRSTYQKQWKLSVCKKKTHYPNDSERTIKRHLYLFSDIISNSIQVDTSFVCQMVKNVRWMLCLFALR